MDLGTKLGPYEIVAKIGAGGMGEVYRAHDARLQRDVAIKVSQEKFTDRFEREARAVAALNHPNICHLYGTRSADRRRELCSGRMRQSSSSKRHPLAFGWRCTRHLTSS